MSLTWSMWIPIHFLTFGGVVPQHLRVHFTAVCSFFTLAAMSALQGRLEERRVVPATEARQSEITRTEAVGGGAVAILVAWGGGR
jgi:hypothetical protein